MKKALVLFSGGLDSILAAKTLVNQHIDVTALSFGSYFFDTQKAEDAALRLGIKIILKDIAKSHLEIVRKPKFGHGAGLNPCIDCHALMIKAAWEIVREKGFDILATGEVLGQRPFSQNKRALADIEKSTNLEGKILRPLSAKLLTPTSFESQGLVERDNLYAIMGRSRKPQLELAKQWGITEFPTPAGGCRLAEKEFSQKLRDLLEKTDTVTPNDFELIRFGRHFWHVIGDKSYGHVILGRNQEENIKLEQLAQKADVIIKKEDEKGPTALIRNAGTNVSTQLCDRVKQDILTFAKNQMHWPMQGWTIINL